MFLFLLSEAGFLSVVYRLAAKQRHRFSLYLLPSHHLTPQPPLLSPASCVNYRNCGVLSCIDFCDRRSQVEPHCSLVLNRSMSDASTFLKSDPLSSLISSFESRISLSSASTTALEVAANGSPLRRRKSFSFGSGKLDARVWRLFCNCWGQSVG